MLISLGNKGSPADLDFHMAMRTCEDCHGGDPTAMGDPEAAHVGLVKDPSGLGQRGCLPCHETIVKDHALSMHATLQGERKTLATRYGVGTFEECPAKAREGYNGECTSCHATCGDCHVSRPDSSGKGLIKNHVIGKVPSQKYQCMGCHGARIGDDFMGNDEEGRLPDTHFARGMTCMSCHDAAEMHQPAGDAAHRYEAPGLPQCEDCHGNKNKANAYHLMHWNTLSCYTCHSQPYANCQGCHVAGVYKDDEAYQENNPFRAFKIGRNPLAGKRFAFGLLRHAPATPDGFAPWGAEDPPAFDAVSTWKYTSPHSILRWTSRTKVAAGAECGANCHLAGDMGGSQANRGLYLFQADVEAGWPLEVGANASVVVDGLLPEGWEAP